MEASGQRRTVGEATPDRNAAPGRPREVQARAASRLPDERRFYPPCLPATAREVTFPTPVLPPVEERCEE